MKRLLVVGLIAAGISTGTAWLASGPAQAVVPSAETGGDISARWCASCHVVSSSGAGLPRGPSFMDLAQALDSTAIVDALMNRHVQPMRGFTLSRREAMDVAAYIKSLKEEQTSQTSQ